MNRKTEKQIGKKDKKKRLCLSILVLIMLLFVPVSYASEIKSDGKTSQAMEEENKTVRVGYFPYANLQEGSYGEHKQGAGYEYLQKISYKPAGSMNMSMVHLKSVWICWQMGK